MKYVIYIIIGIFAVLLIYLGVLNREQPQSKTTEQTRESANTQADRETQADDQPPVAIKVTPVELGKNFQKWRFQLVLDTHAGSLDDDLLQVAALVDNKGNVYQPKAWEGPGPGGHHREGALIFEAINPMPSSVELKIKNVGGVPERSFKWNLE